MIAAQQWVDDYQLHYEINTGGQGTVYVASRHHQLVAVKVYNEGPKYARIQQEEAAFFARVSHPHLVNMLDQRPNAQVQLRGQPLTTRPVLIMEYAEKGDLFDYLRDSGPFSEEAARTYFRQLLSALQYLRQAGVAHRDIKPENILFDSQFGLKIADFGMARESEQNQPLKSVLGTPGYMAPEIYEENYRGTEVDMFAAGVTLFFMVKRRPPFVSTKRNDELYNLIRMGRFEQFWTSIGKKQPKVPFSDELKRLISCTLCADRDKRLSVEGAEEHEWLRGDSLTGEQLKEYMEGKYKKVVEKQPVREKIIELRNEFRQRLVEQALQETGVRSSLDGDECEMSFRELFLLNSNHVKIDLNKLPTYENPSVSYSKEQPSFVAAWIMATVKEMEKHRPRIFEEEEEGSTVIESTHAKFNERGECEIHLECSLGEDRVEARIRGELHANQKKQVGIRWQQGQGDESCLLWLGRRLRQSTAQLQ